jgi:hypothetical protein
MKDTGLGPMESNREGGQGSLWTIAPTKEEDAILTIYNAVICIYCSVWFSLYTVYWTKMKKLSCMI